MLIICPFCEAAYDVPASLIAARRKLRCARCQGDWVPQADIPADPPPPAEPPSLTIPPPPPPVTAPERLAPEPEPPRARSPAALVLLAWVLSFAVLGAVGWGAVNWRQTVMRAWPASVRLYAVLGLEK